MFLKLYELKKKFYTSPASRNSYYFYNKFNHYLTLRRLVVTKKWKAGRGASGKIIIRTKSTLLIKNRHFKLNYNIRYLKLGFIASFRFIPFRNKLISLIYFSNGACSYYATSDKHKLFSFLYYNVFKKMKTIKLKNTFLMLFQIKKLSYISYLELTPGRGAQYTRSSGTEARIIKFDYDTHTVLVQLPSKIKKIFSYYSLVFLGAISLSENFNCLNGKAGYWRRFGIKPLVRGVRTANG